MKYKVLSMLLGVIAAEMVISSYLYFMVFGRKRLPGIPKPEFLKEPNKELKEFRERNQEGEKWVCTKKTEKIKITAHDGVHLAGTMIWNEVETEKVIIAVHGYRGAPMDFFGASIQFYYNLGYHILLVNNRGHGESGGSYIGFGWKDRLDICCWCDYLVKKFRGKVQIVLLGVSMGGAAVMMASGEKLPEQVCCIIEDCGFVSVWNQLKSCFPKRIPIPKHLTLHLASAFCWFIQGYRFKEADAVKQLRKNRRPILFIHGEADDFVPVCSVYEARAATMGKAQLLTVKGAGHVLSYLVETETYEETIKEFLEKYM